ncbi:MAG TPA: CcoQ/FixQ family Cbb3-type cytochrome c oxidase assembly chaperone [Usitatibacter sp.]|nr:CcoQ/FixQ family Cbb3-type cytochrome c oxidase assembly chaperone [Usitatibacter sp.]
MSLDMNTVRIVVTVVSFVTFLGIVWYALSGRNKEHFEQAARLPFEEGSEP